jgi:uncharacterized membrane protein YdjX (TVP38/TMEM64 family)
MSALLSLLLVGVPTAVQSRLNARANVLMGLIAIATNIGEAFVKALQTLIFGPAMSVITSTTANMIALAAPFRIARTAVDYVESFLIDFPIAVLALLRYFGRI